MKLKLFVVILSLVSYASAQGGHVFGLDPPTQTQSCVTTTITTATVGTSVLASSVTSGGVVTATFTGTFTVGSLTPGAVIIGSTFSVSSYNANWFISSINSGTIVATISGSSAFASATSGTLMIGQSVNTPQWLASHKYYKRNWVIPPTPNGHFYSNTGTGDGVLSGSSAPTFPTTTNGTVADANGIVWTEEGKTNAPSGKNSQCFDDYMNIQRCGTAALSGVGSCTHPMDGVAMPLGWGADSGASQSTNPGFETSTGCPSSCASAGYDYTNVDAFINRYANDALFPAAGAGGDLTLIVKPLQNGAVNVYLPWYTLSSAWATTQSASPLDVTFQASGGGVTGTACGGTTIPTAGSANVSTISGGTATDQLCSLASGFPAIWQAPFVNAWKLAITNFLAHVRNVGTSYHTRVVSGSGGVRFGKARGGEDFPANSVELEALAAPNHDKPSLFTVWTTYDKAISDHEATLGVTSPNLMGAFTGGCAAGGTSCITDYTFPDQAAAYAHAAGIPIFQNNGGTLADIALIATWCTPTCPAGKGYSNDFAYIWQTYATLVSGGSRKFNFQMVSPSNPTNADPGSLPNLLPAFALRHATIAEIFKEDVLRAYDPNYTDYTLYGPSAATAIYNFRFSVPSPPTAFTTIGGQGKFGGKSTIGRITVGDPLNENAYCGSGDVPAFGSTDGTANLPENCIYTALNGTPSNGATHTIVTTTDLTNCFAGNSSCPGGTPVCGDILSLTAGNTFTANFTIGSWAVCDASHWLRIQTSNVAGLPAEHSRVNPSYAGVPCGIPVNGFCTTGALPGRPTYSGGSSNVMAKIVSSGITSNLAISISNGDKYIRFIGLEITRPTGGGTMTQLVGFDTNDHIIFDRVWGHGTSTDELRRFVDGNTAHHIASVSSYYTDFHCLSVIGACTDSQVFSAGGSNPLVTDGVYKWVNNFMEAAAENVEQGGGTASFTPSDEEFRLNHFFKPSIWNPADPSYTPVSGNAWIVKNLWETKNSSRVLLEGNILDHNWGGFGQHAEAFEISPKNPSTNLCPLCVVTDTVIRYNYVREVSQFIGWVNEQASNLWAAGGVRGVAHDNIVDGVMYANRNDTTLNPIAMLSGYVTANPPTAADVMTGMVMDHNTLIDVVPPVGMLNLHGPPAGNSTSTPQVTNTHFTNNLLGSGSGTSPLNGDGGGADNCATGFTQPIDVFSACWTSGSSLTGNAIVVQYTGTKTWPTGNLLPASWSAVKLVNYNSGENGDYRLCTGVGTPDAGCTGASPYHNAGTDGKDIGANAAKVMTFYNAAY